MGYRTTGWFAYDITEDYAIPYSLKGNDPQMACGLATAMTPALMSFTELTYTPDRAAVSMYMMAGSCAEEKAHEEALSYLRAFKAQNVSEAKDARIREKRQFAVAAQRQYQAYRHMVAEFGEPGESCPELDRDQEIFWVLGSLAVSSLTKTHHKPKHKNSCTSWNKEDPAKRIEQYKP